MTLHPGRWVYVWQDPPADRALDGYEGALVRAANGVGTTNPAGFDFAANYDRWVARFGAARVSPWTYLYPSSDGTRAAQAVFGSAGRQPWYQVDMEDAVPAATVRTFCDVLHTLAPGCVIIFDSYPTRAQFVRINGATGAATWDQAVRSFDAFCPQVYYSSQRDDGWEREFAGKPITPAFSPASWADWGYIQRNLDTYGSAKLWRYPLTDDWRGKLTWEGTMSDVGAERWDARDWAAHPPNLAGGEDRTTTFGNLLGSFGGGVVGLHAKVDALRTELVAVRESVGTLTDDEANIIAAYRAGQVELLAAVGALQAGDPGPLVDEIRKQPQETIDLLLRRLQA